MVEGENPSGRLASLGGAFAGVDMIRFISGILPIMKAGGGPLIPCLSSFSRMFLGLAYKTLQSHVNIIIHTTIHNADRGWSITSGNITLSS